MIIFAFDWLLFSFPTSLTKYHNIYCSSTLSVSKQSNINRRIGARAANQTYYNYEKVVSIGGSIRHNGLYRLF